MSTITTKQLRDTMATVVRDLQNGKSVQLSYRQTVIGTIQPVAQPVAALHRGSARAVRQFLASNNFGSVPSRLQTSSKSFKQELAELREQDVASR